jgi:hypothetical protein
MIMLNLITKIGIEIKGSSTGVDGDSSIVFLAVNGKKEMMKQNIILVEYTIIKDNTYSNCNYTYTAKKIVS